MAVFGWISDRLRPRAPWDLSACGWELCEAGCSGPGTLDARTDCRHILLVDAAELSPQARRALVNDDRPAWRLLMLGVEDSHERADLIALGCAEVLPASITLRELDTRARRVSEMFQCLPRWREAGPLMLDLFHRDGRLERRWLGLHPREFGLLWRLAERAGQRVTRKQLLHDVWRLDHDPETNSVEVHVSRLRGKLARLGCASLIETVPEGGYRIGGLGAGAQRTSLCCADSSCDAGQVAVLGEGVHG